MNNENQNSTKKADDRVFLKKLFVRYFLGSALAILCGSIGQVTGNIIVGNAIDESKLAVMSLVLPIYYVFATVGNLTGIGGSTVCASLIGKRENEECKKAYTTTYVLTIVLTVAFSVLILALLPQTIRLLGTPSELYQDVWDYAVIMTACGVFTAGVYLSFNYLRLDGKTTATIMTFVIMAAVNVTLDVVFAIGLNMGVMGVSIATSLGAIAATLFGVIMIAKNSETLGFAKISMKDFVDYSKKIFFVGSPGAVENVAILLKAGTLNKIIVATSGATVLSALSVVNSVNSFATAIVFGGAGALIPFVGVFTTERDITSLRRMVRSACQVCGLLLGVFTLLMEIFAPNVAGIFGISSPEVLAETTSAVRLFSLSLIPSMLANILIYVQIANKQTIISNILTFCRNYLFLVIFALLLMPGLHGTGLWIAFVLCEIFTLGFAQLLQAIARKNNPYLSPMLLLDTSVEKKGSAIALSTFDDEDSIMDAVNQLNSFCEENELDPRQSMLITMAMEEMLNSVAEHATRGSDQHVLSVRVYAYQEVIVLRIRYAGEMFNPIDYYEQMQKQNAAKEGEEIDELEAMLNLNDSLGIKMIVDAADVVDYRTTFGINNLTILV